MLDPRVEQLLRTTSEFEFFAIVCTLNSPLPQPDPPLITTELHTTHDNGHGYGFKLETTQNLTLWDGKQRAGWRGITHRFTLYQDDTLQWEILGQPTVTGLENIQSLIRQAWQGNFQPQLESGIAHARQENQSYPPGSLEAQALTSMASKPTLRLDLSAVKRPTKGTAQ